MEGVDCIDMDVASYCDVDDVVDADDDDNEEDIVKEVSNAIVVVVVVGYLGSFCIYYRGYLKI